MINKIELIFRINGEDVKILPDSASKYWLVAPIPADMKDVKAVKITVERLDESSENNQAECKSVAQSITNEQYEKALKENVQIICDAYKEWRDKEDEKLFEKVKALRKQVDEMRKSNSEIHYERLLQNNYMPRRCGDIKIDESENDNAKN